MEGKTWTVVLFVDDKSVEAVPSTWIQGDFCHWPSLTSEKLSQAIKRCEPLNTSWPTHRIQIFRHATFGDYARARAKTKVAEFHSDLNTDEEETYKRKRIQKILSSSSDESEILSDSVNLPPPPKLKRTKRQDSEINEYAATCDLDDTHSTRIQFQQLGRNESLVVNGTNCEEENINYNCEGCREKDNLKDGINTLTHQVHILRELAVDTLSEVKSLKTIIKNNGTQQHVKESFSMKYPVVKFPFNSIEELEYLEEILEVNKDDLELLATEIAKIGGTNCYNFVKRALSTVITNEVALKYSWLGRKGKRVFSKLNVAKVLIFAAEKANVCKDRSEVEVSIQTWLKRASDRRVNALKHSVIEHI